MEILIVPHLMSVQVHCDLLGKKCQKFSLSCVLGILVYGILEMLSRASLNQLLFRALMTNAVWETC